MAVDIPTYSKLTPKYITIECLNKIYIKQYIHKYIMRNGVMSTCWFTF